MRGIRIGDRFKGSSIWEVIEIGQYSCRCLMIEALSEHDQKFEGCVEKFYTTALTSINFEYIGNFAKADNFEELYNLMNE